MVRLFFAQDDTISSVPTARTCLVSFTDSENARHASEVTATTLYEAAVLAIAEFRRCGFTANAPGPATRFTVKVKVRAPATSHEVQLGENRDMAPERGSRMSMKGRRLAARPALSRREKRRAVQLRSTL